jgi:toxin ParE1/3/4
MVRVIRSRKAKKEIIKAVADTKKQWGVDQARKYRQLIEMSIKAIGKHPKLGRSYSDVCPSIRGYHLKSPARHIIFYETVDKDTVTVVRFIHDSMDLDRHIKSSFLITQL